MSINQLDATQKPQLELLNDDNGHDSQMDYGSLTHFSSSTKLTNSSINNEKSTNHGDTAFINEVCNTESGNTLSGQFERNRRHGSCEVTVNGSNVHIVHQRSFLQVSTIILGNNSSIKPVD